MTLNQTHPPALNDAEVEKRIKTLLNRMTLPEKIGQMAQWPGHGKLDGDLCDAIRKGQVGSVLNEVDTEILNEYQRIALEESRLGIPLIIGRDVIHGFHTMLPIPLGQAATWSPELLEQGAHMAAREAREVGIHWTFAPMIDITRDPRWGRIAESLGEDPYLTSVLGAAMVKGFQGDDLSADDRLAACAKHFAAYGYSEAGRDYAYVNLNEHELRNIVLRPFKAAAAAGVASFMTGFSDLNGVPASANEFLNRQILRAEWDYKGFVVSDWDSIIQLITHGFSENEKEAAAAAINAGVNMEMTSRSYLHHLEELIEEGRVDEELIDEAVSLILRIKFKLGLFEKAVIEAPQPADVPRPEHLDIAYQTALESVVLLKNDYHVLPLNRHAQRNVAVIGPLADDAYEQLGTWTFDGIEAWTETPLAALRRELPEHVQIHYAKGLSHTRSYDRSGFGEALEAASRSETVIMFMGEEAILSGEAHSRADINLPGAQNELLQELSRLGKTTVLVIMAGRPLTLDLTRHTTNALLYAWHPGTMGGKAIVDLILGEKTPSGKLPVSFPKHVGQIPIYYNQRSSGRPASRDSYVHIDEIPVRAPQTSVGNYSFHMDAGFEPLYPFGFGLSYTQFNFGEVYLEKERFAMGETISIYIDITNVGVREGAEVVQLYVRDRFASITRPVRELKRFKKVLLKPGEWQRLSFELTSADLEYFCKNKRWKAEPGDFDVWIGSDSRAHHHAQFTLTA